MLWKKIATRARFGWKAHSGKTDAPRPFAPFGEGARRNAWRVMPAHGTRGGRNRTMSEQKKATPHRRLERVWNQGKLELIDQLTAPNAVYHDPNVPGGQFKGPAGVKQFVQIYRA